MTLLKKVKKAMLRYGEDINSRGQHDLDAQWVVERLEKLDPSTWYNKEYLIDHFTEVKG